jgi:hypothetical protein
MNFTPPHSPAVFTPTQILNIYIQKRRHEPEAKMSTRGEGGRTVSIRRRGNEIEKVVRLIFLGPALRKKAQYEKAVGFVNYRGQIRAIYASPDGTLFLNLEDASVKGLPLHRARPERY